MNHPYREKADAPMTIEQAVELRLQARKKAEEKYEEIRDNLPEYLKKPEDDKQKLAVQIQQVRTQVMEEIRKTLKPETEIAPTEAIHMVVRNVFERLGIKPSAQTNFFVRQLAMKMEAVNSHPLRLADFENLINTVVDTLLSESDILKKLAGETFLEPKQPVVDFKMVGNVASSYNPSTQDSPELSTKIVQEALLKSGVKNIEDPFLVALTDSWPLIGNRPQDTLKNLYDIRPIWMDVASFSAELLAAIGAINVFIGENKLSTLGKVYCSVLIVLSLLIIPCLRTTKYGLKTQTSEKNKILAMKISPKVEQIYKILIDIYNLFSALEKCPDENGKQKINEKILILFELLQRLRNGEKLATDRGGVKIDFTELLPELKNLTAEDGRLGAGTNCSGSTDATAAKSVPIADPEKSVTGTKRRIKLTPGSLAKPDVVLEELEETATATEEQAIEEAVASAAAGGARGRIMKRQ